MIHLSNISTVFSGHHVLFNQLNLTVDPGDNIALIGPSGCGKSTLLRYLLGVLSPDKGRVFVDGVALDQRDQCQLNQMRLSMGMLFQSAALFDSFTVEENIAFPLIENKGASLNSARKKVNQVLDMVDLGGYNLKMPYQLSGGQKKRVGLARAIVTDPTYLLFDEPTAGLDPLTTTTIEDVIIRLSSALNATTVIVSHTPSTILRTAKKIYMIHNNALLDFETPDTIETTDTTIIRNFMKG